MNARIDLTGKRFGRWLVLVYAGAMKWRCRCDCGNELDVAGTSLRRGLSKGCFRCKPNSQRRTHGASRTRLYRCWEAMKYRCENPNATAYARYGGRGIRVCDAWSKSFEAFRDWALSHGYADNLTIDRFPNSDGNYEPVNCRWATYAEQNRNYARNRHLIVDGEKLVAADLAARAGLPADVVRQRIHRYGWSIDEAVSTPVKARVRNEPWRAVGMSRSTYYRSLRR